MATACFLAGVSNRRMDKLVKPLGINCVSKLLVSHIAESMHEHVEQFHHRPLERGQPAHACLRRHPHHEGPPRRDVINAVALSVTTLDGDSHGEMLGTRVAAPETGRAVDIRCASGIGRGDRRAPAPRGLTTPPHHHAANVTVVTPKSMRPAVETMLDSA